MSQQLTITIDGKQCTCEKGEYLLDVAKRNGIFIPTLCHHEGLGGIGSCRVCICEVVARGRSQVVTSCIYPVEGEIEVFTKNERIKEQRAIILALLHHLAPASETISQMAAFMGADLPRLADKEGGEKCILCGRCTTACEQIGTGAIAKCGRGVTKEIATPYHQPTAECIGCAACANVCPTGEITCEQTDESVTIWGKTFEYLRCSCCGEPFATREQYEFAASKRHLPADPDTAAATGQDPEPLCEACEKRATAQRLAKNSIQFVVEP
ncbi:MAG: (2Fe-2S)-binding protein [Coriobacteriales bacterium]|jgi:NADH dehydrogenase/NADH:ubiquinone oxidoreductase subunit G|nr:(2Fe-2S)-binding protein [Coriobacteriales bacterium]